MKMDQVKDRLTFSQIIVYDSTPPPHALLFKSKKHKLMLCGIAYIYQSGTNTILLSAETVSIWPTTQRALPFIIVSSGYYFIILQSYHFIFSFFL